MGVVRPVCAAVVVPEKPYCCRKLTEMPVFCGQSGGGVARSLEAEEKVPCPGGDSERLTQHLPCPCVVSGTQASCCPNLSPLATGPAGAWSPCQWLTSIALCSSRWSERTVTAQLQVTPSTPLSGSTSYPSAWSTSWPVWKSAR